jgi:hypothetical protein
MRLAPKRLALILLLALFLSACGGDPTQPDMSTRESFATTVLTTAASGSVEEVEKLAGEGQIDTRTRAQHLVDFAKGWDASPGEIKISHEWPEIVDVVATKKDSSESIQFGYAWAHGRWGLGLGPQRNPPTGGAVPGTPGTGTPKIIEPSK